MRNWTGIHTRFIYNSALSYKIVDKIVEKNINIRSRWKGIHIRFIE